MTGLKDEIRRLINRLNTTALQETGPEAAVRGYLKRFLAALESGGGQTGNGAADAAYAELRQYWLDAVPWCSDLSRDLEKLIIMYTDTDESDG